MALNTNQQQREKSAARDHRKKLILESLFLPAIRNKFDQVSRDFQKTYGKAGVPPDVSAHTDDFRDLLEDHYDKVSSSFDSEITKELGTPENDAQVQQDIQLDLQINKAIYANQSSQYIGQTNQNNINDSLKKVILGAAAAGVFLTYRQIAKKAKEDIDEKFAARAPMIALTETQRPAEHAKQAELNSLVNNNAVIDDVDFSATSNKKEWVAILDNVTRDAHAEADGQEQDYDDPYIVMDEKLMYPGDTSMGASMRNIANCRCSSVPVVR